MRGYTVSDSYHNARIGGISDGTVEGQRGANDYAAHKRHLEAQKQMFSGQQAASYNVGNEIGNGLMRVIAGLFLHKYFSFLGFYIICLVPLGVAVENADGLLRDTMGLDLNNPSTKIGLNIFIFTLPVVLAVLLRKIIPTMMKWIFFILIGGITLAFVGGIVFAIIEKTGSS